MTAYTKTCYPNIFGDGEWTNYYKEGKLIATRDNDGKIKLLPCGGPAYDALTRAKGYRYWWKHFPDRYCWSLPQELQDALDMAPTTRGYFVDRNGHLCGYEG